jgi:hypothetical protein
MAYRDYGGCGDTGDDIICDKGTPVYAICDSTFERSLEQPGGLRLACGDGRRY